MPRAPRYRSLHGFDACDLPAPLFSTTRDLDHEHQHLSAAVTARDVDLTVALIGTHFFSTAQNMLERDDSLWLEPQD